MKRFCMLFMVFLMAMFPAFAEEEMNGQTVKGTLEEMGYSLDDLNALLPPPIEVKIEDGAAMLKDDQYSSVDAALDAADMAIGTLNNGMWVLEIGSADPTNSSINVYRKGGVHWRFGMDGQLEYTKLNPENMFIAYIEGEWELQPYEQLEAQYHTATYDGQGQLTRYVYRDTFSIADTNQILTAEVFYDANGRLTGVDMYRESGIDMYMQGSVYTYLPRANKGNGAWYDADGNICEGPGALEGLSYEEIVTVFPPLYVTAAEQE